MHTCGWSSPHGAHLLENVPPGDNLSDVRPLGSENRPRSEVGEGLKVDRVRGDDVSPLDGLQR